MTYTEARDLLRIAHSSVDDPIDAEVGVLNMIYRDFKHETTKLQEQVAYWKLSFHKQCEARRD